MIRLGLMGCADFALRRMLPAVDRTAGIATVAVASREPARAAEVARAHGADAVPDYDALLEHPDVDAVYLPLPPALHAEWIERALHAGKHVLAEKPLTTDAARTAALIALARRERLALVENHLFLHHGQHQRIRRLLADGVIGELRAFSAAFTIPPRPPGDIRYRGELGGGALFDVGGYPLRAALLLLGTDLEVAGARLRHDERLGVDTGGAALLSRGDGVTAHLTFGMEHFYRSSYSVLGSTGRIELTHAFTPPADHAPVVRIETAAGVRELVLAPEDQGTAAVAAFVRTVKEKAGPYPVVSRQAELIDTIRRADGPPARR